MRARRIIEGAAFGPEVLRLAIEGFEAAWAEIAERFDPVEHEAIRERLAVAIISAARAGSKDANQLRVAGLGAMGRAYPDRFPPPSSDTARRKEN